MAGEQTTNVASPGAAQAAGAPTSSPTPTAPADVRPGATAAPEVPGAPETAATPPAAAEPTETPKAEAEVPEFGPRFAALAKKERALTEREKAIKAQERAVQDYAKAKENARLDPLGLLEAHGLSFDDVTQFVINDRKLTEAQRLALLEERIKRDEEQKSKEAKDRERQEVESTITEHKDAIASFVHAGGDDFELVRAHGQDGVELVHQVVQDYWEANGQILPIDRAAKEVEAWLENQAREKVLKLKRFQPKQEVMEPATPPQGDQAGADAGGETRKPPTPTLTNRASATAPPAESHNDLSDEDSKRKAAQLLRWS